MLEPDDTAIIVKVFGSRHLMEEMIGVFIQIGVCGIRNSEVQNDATRMELLILRQKR